MRLEFVSTAKKEKTSKRVNSNNIPVLKENTNEGEKTEVGEQKRDA